MVMDAAGRLHVLGRASMPSSRRGELTWAARVGRLWRPPLSAFVTSGFGLCWDRRGSDERLAPTQGPKEGDLRWPLGGATAKR